MRQEVLSRIGDYNPIYKAYDPAIGRALYEGIKDLPLGENADRFYSVKVATMGYFAPDWPGLAPVIGEVEDPHRVASAVRTAASGRAIKGDWNAVDSILGEARARGLEIGSTPMLYAVAVAARERNWERASDYAREGFTTHTNDGWLALAMEALRQGEWDALAAALNRLHENDPASSDFVNPDTLDVRLALGGFIVEREGVDVAYDPQAVFEDAVEAIRGRDSRSEMFAFADLIAAYHYFGFDDHAATLRGARGHESTHLSADITRVDMLLKAGNAEAASVMLAPVLDILRDELANPPSTEALINADRALQYKIDEGYPRVVTVAATSLIALGRDDEARTLVAKFGKFYTETTDFWMPGRGARFLRNTMKNILALDLDSLEGAEAIWASTGFADKAQHKALAKAGYHERLLEILLPRVPWVTHFWTDYAASIEDEDDRNTFLTALLDASDRRIAKDEAGFWTPVLADLTVTAARTGDWPRANAYYDAMGYGVYRLQALIALAALLSDDMREPVRYTVDFFRTP